ncbi:MAG TPA: chemotaxis protein CheW [Gemmatimonadales bacterium]|nr:chemotaxis protein CheW [Gemmatimonadales bacterium]
MSRESTGFLLVRVGSRRVGLQLSDVLEVIALGDVHPVPAVEPAVRGVVAVQGRMLPLVQLGALLDGVNQSPLAGDVGVVVAVEGRRFCLEVHEAELLVREPALPVPPGEAMPWAVGVARHADTLVPLLDLTALSSRLMEAVWT